MNLEEVYKHPLAEAYSELLKYSQEPGDPIWEKARHEISTMALINQPIMEKVVWKSKVYDALMSAYNKYPDKDKFFSDELTMYRIMKMLTGSFEHLNEIENGK